MFNNFTLQLGAVLGTNIFLPLSECFDSTFRFYFIVFILLALIPNLHKQFTYT